MVYGRRKIKRTTRSGRKSYRKRFKTNDFIRKSNMYSTHRFKRSTLETKSLMDIDLYQAYSFQLNDVPNYTEFTNLFEEYSISGIRMTFIWDKNSATNDTGVITPGDNQFIPTLFWSFDNNDNTAPANLNEMVERADCKFRRMDRPVSVFFRPAVRQEMYQSAVSTGYGPKWGVWVNTADYAVDFYGIKFAINGGVNGGTGQDPIGKLSIITTYYIKCKGVK